MDTNIASMRPGAAAKAEELLKEVTAVGIPHAVTSTRRTTPEQIALWLQGRAPLEIVQLLRKYAGMRPLDPKENLYTVTQVDGVNRVGAHQDGTAIDIVVLETVDLAKPGEAARRVQRPSWDYAKHAKAYRAIADIARRLGWNSGANWPPINPETLLGTDPPHHQIG